MNRFLVLVLSLVLEILASGPAQSEEPYPDPLPRLIEELDTVLDAVYTADTANTGAVEDRWDALVVWSVADAVLDQQRETAASILALTTQAETRRLDKQIGASPGSGGETSLTNRPNWPALLGFAVDHGSVEQKVDGTNATFTTTPYAIFRMLPIEEAELKRSLGFLEHVGASITVPTSGQDVAFGRMRNYTLSIGLGSRKPNTPAFREMWKDTLLAVVQAAIDARAGSYASLYAASNEEERDLERTSDTLRMRVIKYRPASRADLRDQILRLLYSEIYVPTTKSTWKRSQALKAAILPQAIKIVESEAALAKVTAAIDEARRKPLFALRYINNRPDAGQNYSTFELGAQVTTIKAPRLFDLIANADISIFHEPPEGQGDLRSYSGSLVLVTGWDSPFISQQLDRSQLTASLSVKVKRREDQPAGDEFTQALVLGGLAIPVNTGMTLPVALSWASRTEERDEPELRINFGLGLDLDVLEAVASASKAIGSASP